MSGLTDGVAALVCRYGGDVCTLFFFFFNDTATTEIYTLSLHDALPILATGSRPRVLPIDGADLDGVFDLRNLADVERIRQIGRAHV